MENKEEIDALLVTAREQKPLEFQAGVNDILGQRIADALERRRMDAVASVFGEKSHETLDISGENDEGINSDANETGEEPGNGEDDQRTSS